MDGRCNVEPHHRSAHFTSFFAPASESPTKVALSREVSALRSLSCSFNSSLSMPAMDDQSVEENEEDSEREMQQEEQQDPSIFDSFSWNDFPSLGKGPTDSPSRGLKLSAKMDAQGLSEAIYNMNINPDDDEDDDDDDDGNFPLLIGPGMLGKIGGKQCQQEESSSLPNSLFSNDSININPEDQEKFDIFQLPTPSMLTTSSSMSSGRLEEDMADEKLPDLLEVSDTGESDMSSMFTKTESYRSSQSSTKTPSHVRFNVVFVREYSLILEEDSAELSTISSSSLTLDWDHTDTVKVDIDNYETARAPHKEWRRGLGLEGGGGKNLARRLSDEERLARWQRVTGKSLVQKECPRSSFRVRCVASGSEGNDDESPGSAQPSSSSQRNGRGHSKRPLRREKSFCDEETSTHERKTFTI